MKRPTAVLVHGAFADASGFGGVLRELTRAGYAAVAPATPLRGLPSDAAAIGAVAAAIDGPVVLIGHAYGGAVISQASAGLANVTRLARPKRPEGGQHQLGGGLGHRGHRFAGGIGEKQRYRLVAWCDGLPGVRRDGQRVGTCLA